MIFVILKFKRDSTKSNLTITLTMNSYEHFSEPITKELHVEKSSI